MKRRPAGLAFTTDIRRNRKEIWRNARFIARLLLQERRNAVTGRSSDVVWD